MSQTIHTPDLYMVLFARGVKQDVTVQKVCWRVWMVSCMCNSFTVCLWVQKLPCLRFIGDVLLLWYKYKFCRNHFSIAAFSHYLISTLRLQISNQTQANQTDFISFQREKKRVICQRTFRQGSYGILGNTTKTIPGLNECVEENSEEWKVERRVTNH